MSATPVTQAGSTLPGNEFPLGATVTPRDPDALAIALYLDGSDDPDQAPDGTWLARGPSSRSGARV
jgi:hypothetical protein